MVQMRAESESAFSGQLTDSAEMIRVDGGTFRMGSDRHYPEEAPVHRVTVDGFWIDRVPVTNRQFRAFVQATGHVTPAGPASYVGFGCILRKRSAP